VWLSHLYSVPLTISICTNRALAETAFEDTYLTVLDIDGPEWADKLRAKMHVQPRAGGPLPTEQSWLLYSDRMV
jgi:hypothetical protein